MSAASDALGWPARLELGFENAGDRTLLVHRRHLGPLMVQRPFYPEGGICHVYVLHPPGGVVAGDTLALQATLGSGAHALLTTPAATKLYRSHGPRARIVQSLSVAPDATLEWLPQDTIAFAGCNAHVSTRVDLRASSRFIGWEMLCLGRPASGERFHAGLMRQDLEVWRDDVPVLVERNRCQADSALMHEAWGLNGHVAMATLVAHPSGEHVVAAARDVLNEFDAGHAAATEVDGLLVCRAIAHGMLALKSLMSTLWSALRPRMLMREMCAPRIWAT